ncbi:SDR family NAD(P)-dependent oxidoreductase [Aurantiacibacter hainanensis]|uniref:SDR family NAD(P)-dependent oxidoreductase n=1 Tax=Aurantiacibacter hainanensis TaxID=3076114 RepID=UPI0030C6A802
MIDLSGKVFLVAGATSGLGAATARKLASLGARVSLAGRRQDRGDGLVREIEQSGGAALFVRTDVKLADEVDAMVARTVEHFGKLDGAVNNAGISNSVMTPAADITDEDWHEMIAVNLTSVWRCMKAEIPALLANGTGSIVNVSSVYGLIGSEIGHAGYSAAKFGVIGLTESAAIDYGQSGLRINAICPGYCHSEMVDPYVESEPELMANIVEHHSAMNRLGEAEEIADAIAWLLSSQASFVNGASLPVNGGRTAKLY